MTLHNEDQLCNSLPESRRQLEADNFIGHMNKRNRDSPFRIMDITQKAGLIRAGAKRRQYCPPEYIISASLQVMEGGYRRGNVERPMEVTTFVVALK